MKVSANGASLHYVVDGHGPWLTLAHPLGADLTVWDDLVPELASVFAAGTLRLEGDEKPCAPAELRLTGPREAELVLIEGRYHQVRRMFAAVGATVLTLHRLAFGPLTLDGLPAGKWRELPLDFFASGAGNDDPT